MSTSAKPPSLITLLLNPSPFVRYGNAVLFTLIAFLFSSLLQRFIADVPYGFFYVSVILTAWLSGLAPALFAAVLAVILEEVFLTEPFLVLWSTTADVLESLLFLGIATFISYIEHRRSVTEKRLTTTRDQLQAIFDAAVDGITAQDKDGRWVFANEAGARYGGFNSTAEMFAADPLKTRQRYTVSAEDGSPFDWEQLPRRVVYRTGQPAEVIMRSKDNQTGIESWLRIKTAPVKDEKGDIPYVVNIISDISRIKQSEIELKRLNDIVAEQSRRLNNVVANIPGIVWESSATADGTQTITFVNEYAEQMLGYTTDEWRSTPNFFSRLIHPEDGDIALKSATEIFESGKPGITQLRFITKDENVIYVETRSVITRDEAGTGYTLYGTIVDTSHRVAYEQALSEAAENMRRSNEDLEQFAYIASHDLQEPLRMVTSYLQLVEQRYSSKLDDDGREFIHYAVDGAMRMKGLIGDLLAYSRVQRSVDGFKLVDSGRALDKALSNIQLAIEDSGAVVTRDQMPQVYGSEPQFVQLLQNLIGNAIKFRREGVTPHIHVGVTRQRREWVFSVRDNGIGIEPQYIDRIFVIFQRLHTKAKYPGTGIGLAIVKKAVENHNGRVWVESQPGQGSTFFFAIPAGKIPASTEAVQSSNGQPTLTHPLEQTTHDHVND